MFSLTAATPPDRTAMTELAGLARSAASDIGISCQWLAPTLRMAAMASGNWPLSPRPGTGGWSCFPRLALRTPSPDARSVRAGRDFAIATMHRWGAAERSDDIAVVVSELLTNALRHALPDAARRRDARSGSPCCSRGRSVICAVADPSPKTPASRQPGRALRGRPRASGHQRARRQLGLHPTQPRGQGGVGPVLREHPGGAVLAYQVTAPSPEISYMRRISRATPIRRVAAASSANSPSMRSSLVTR